MFFKGHRKLQTQLYLAYLGIILFFLGTFSMFFYVFVSGKLKDEAFKEANPQKPQPVPYEIDSHKGIDMGHSPHEHSDANSGATRK